MNSRFKIQGSRFATSKASGQELKVHRTKHGEGGSGVPPLIFQSQKGGRHFHFTGRKTGAKRWEQAIFRTVVLPVLDEWQVFFFIFHARLYFLRGRIYSDLVGFGVFFWRLAAPGNASIARVTPRTFGASVKSVKSVVQHKRRTTDGTDGTDKDKGTGHFPVAILACQPFPGLSFTSFTRRLWHIPERTENLPSVFRHDFFGGVGSPLVAHKEGLATEKIPKKRKNATKSAKYFPSDPGFSAERAGF